MDVNQDPKAIYPMRQIKSFVRREGRMTEAQKRALDVLFPLFGLKAEPEVQCNFEKIFGNHHPVVLEIGFGMGDSLIAMAEAQPHLNFIGIEVHRPGIGVLLNKIEEKHLKNIRVMDGDAVEILENFFLDESLSRVNLYFPDPWHKARHHKRRIVQPKFLKLLAKKLVAGGIFHAATDWENYAEHMMEVLSASPYFFNLFGEQAFSKDSMDRPETKFERRGVKLGHGVWDLVFIREKDLTDIEAVEDLREELPEDLANDLAKDLNDSFEDLEGDLGDHLLEGFFDDLPDDLTGDLAEGLASDLEAGDETFELNPILERDSVFLGDFPLSQCRLMNAKEFPWLLLIPRQEGMRDWIDLDFEDQLQLQGEINLAAQILKQVFQEVFSDFVCEKLNIASIGNIVPQLHIHVVARHSGDSAWPKPVWGMPISPYTEKEIADIVQEFSQVVQNLLNS
jgi:tRNA (guanine-N7-)-methyltransferase